MDMLQPYIALDLAEATRLYEAANAIGVKFSTTSWSPDREAWARERGRTSPEFISIHCTCLTPGMVEALSALGFTGSIKAGMSRLVQKHGPWPSDRYNTISEAEQVQADLRWIDAGGWLGEEKLARLERYGHRVR